MHLAREDRPETFRGLHREVPMAWGSAKPPLMALWPLKNGIWIWRWPAKMLVISAKNWDVNIGLNCCIPPKKSESSQGIPRIHIRWGNGHQPSKGHGSEKLVAQGHEANWTHNPSGFRGFFGSQLAMKTRKWHESGTRSQPFGQAAKLPGSKTAESPSVPASEPDRTQSLQRFDSFDLPYFTHGFRWRWIYG